MYLNDLSFGNLIELDIPQNKCEKNIRILTKVDSVQNDVLKAAIPEELKLLKDITEVILYYKADGKCKKWSCRLVGFEKSNLITLIVLFCNSKAEDINNRDTFRLPYFEEVTYEFEGKKIKGRYKDLSAKGVGFYSDEEHKIGDELVFVVDDMGYKIDVGKIVRRIQENQKHNRFKYLYGVKFEDINENLMSYVFEKQSELIRKRKSLQI